MHVLVVGGGGREHALAWKLAQSPRVTRISVTPGNAGTAAFAENVPIDATDIISLLEFAEQTKVDLTIVGPEEPLAGGLVDQFDAAGLRIFGPSRQAAMVETSKSYAKQVMTYNGVPTPPHELFTDLASALDYLSTQSYDNIVIKADGLARGKGVFLPQGETDAQGILRSLLERDALGRAGRRVLIEQRMSGDELSVMAFTDGNSVALMPAVRDHKRLYARDLGPNTGGMGAYAPSPVMTPELAEQVRTQIIEPVLEGLQREKCCFKGVIYVGLVLTQNGPLVLELNTRLGDPGAQVILPLLETDLLELLEACVNGELDQMDIRWYNQAAASVVLASANYPERSDPGVPVILPSATPSGVILFHAGTRINRDGVLITTGGRVIDVTGIGPNVPSAIALAYDAVRHIHFDGMQFRTDIGMRAIWRDS